MLVGIAAPYKDASDDYFAKACSFALTMFFFFVTVPKIGVLTEQLDKSIVYRTEPDFWTLGVCAYHW